MDNHNENGREAIISQARKLILENCPQLGVFKLPHLKNVFMARKDVPGASLHCLEKPMVALHAQGNKIINIGQQEFHLQPGTILVNCVDIPSNNILMDASPGHPMLSMWFTPDKQILSELTVEMEGRDFDKRQNWHTYGIMEGGLDLLDGFLRLARLGGRADDAAVLGPMILKELHYYLLTSPLGGMLRNLYLSGARDNRIIEALAWLKKNLNKPVPIEELARTVNMSVSSLHRHFKQITGFSPLQYHKNLRLYEAQRLMLAENERADLAALAVGYESVTQFNREYKRMFGEPPRRDIIRRRKN